MRRRTVRYYIDGKGTESDRAGLGQFLTDHGITPVGVRMIDTNRGRLAAKITAYKTDKHIVESDIWHRKMYCSAFH